jgi:hypothetical protein
MHYYEGAFIQKAPKVEESKSVDGRLQCGIRVETRSTRGFALDSSDTT